MLVEADVCSCVCYALQVAGIRYRYSRLFNRIAYAAYNGGNGNGEFAGMRVTVNFIIMPFQYMRQRSSGKIMGFTQQLFTVLYRQLMHKPCLHFIQPGLGIADEEEGIEPLVFVKAACFGRNIVGNCVVHALGVYRIENCMNQPTQKRSVGWFMWC